MTTTDEATGVARGIEAPSASELERLMGAYLAALARVRLTRAALRDGLARHQGHHSEASAGAGAARSSRNF